MTFPGAYSVVLRNSDGEPIGWDNTAYFEPPETDPGDFDPACFDIDEREHRVTHSPADQGTAETDSSMTNDRSHVPRHPLPDWLTPGQWRTIEHFQAYNVSAEWFVNPPDEQGRVKVLALGYDTDAGSDAEGFIWSLIIEPDGEYGASEATVGQWETGISI